MENATKALLIAGGVLIGIMILSLGVALFAEMNSYVESSNERVLNNKQNEFNRQFLNYLNIELKIQDIVTVANLAHENNVNNNLTDASRGNQNEPYVAVYLDGNSIESSINDNSVRLLTENLSKTYKCEYKDGNNQTGVRISEITGRVYEIYFYTE